MDAPVGDQDVAGAVEDQSGREGEGLGLGRSAAAASSMTGSGGGYGNYGAEAVRVQGWGRAVRR